MESGISILRDQRLGKLNCRSDLGTNAGFTRQVRAVTETPPEQPFDGPPEFLCDSCCELVPSETSSFALWNASANEVKVLRRDARKLYYRLYEVDYLPALKGKTCVGIALYIWRALAMVD
jgi:hypothetical protein